MSDVELADFCTFHEDYVSRNIQLADAKAALALVAFSSVIAVGLKDAHFLSALRGAFPLAPSLSFSCSSTLAWLAVIFCGGGAGMALWVVIPRFQTGRSDEEELGYTYWSDVSKRAGGGDGKTYLAAIRKLTLSQLIDDRLCHLAQLSRVCARKMSWLPRSMWCGAAGACAAALWIIFYAQGIGD